MSKTREHLQGVDESYFEHMGHALTYSGRLLVAGFACAIHAFLPSRCATTASSEINRLQAEITARKTGTN